MSGILLLFPVCSVSVSILGSVRWEGVVVGCAVYGICINCASCFPFHKIRKNDTIAILQNEHSISHSVLFLPPPPQFLKFPLLFYTEVASQNKTALQWTGAIFWFKTGWQASSAHIKTLSAMLSLLECIYNVVHTHRQASRHRRRRRMFKQLCCYRKGFSSYSLEPVKELTQPLLGVNPQ